MSLSFCYEVNKDIVVVKPGSYWAEWPSQLVLLTMCLKNHGNVLLSVRNHSETVQIMLFPSS